MAKFSALLLATLVTTATAHADVKNNTSAALSPQSVIENQLKKIDASIPIESIIESPMPGVYQVTIQGGNIFYSSATGQHLLRGDMLEVRGERLVNLSEEQKSRQNAKLLKTLNTEDMVIFSPKGETKGVVYAFTDVDCGYCRKLHREVGELNDLGIELRYLAFPRGGKNSPVFNKLADAWCSVDRKQAMNDLKAGKSISVEIAGDVNACKSVIDRQYNLGVQMGVSGTPAMVLESGRMIPGYRPAADIASMLGTES